MLIIGSRAIKHWFPDYDKPLNDTDFICTELPPEESRYQYCEYYQSDTTDHIIAINKDAVYIDPDLLYTLKVSHLAWAGRNGKWWKHLKDAIFLKNHGCTLQKDIFKLLYNEWENRFGDKNYIKLDKPVKQFFKDGIKRTFDHDYLHEYFAIGDIPVYKKILFNSDSPMCSEELFLTLSKEEQYYTALEEMFVISFERGLPLPEGYKALVTHMTKGWWNLFLIENAEALLSGFTEEKNIYYMKKERIHNELKPRN